MLSAKSVNTLPSVGTEGWVALYLQNGVRFFISYFTIPCTTLRFYSLPFPISRRRAWGCTIRNPRVKTRGYNQEVPTEPGCGNNRQVGNRLIIKQTLKSVKTASSNKSVIQNPVVKLSRGVGNTLFTKWSAVFFVRFFISYFTIPCTTLRFCSLPFPKSSRMV